MTRRQAIPPLRKTLTGLLAGAVMGLGQMPAGGGGGAARAQGAPSSLPASSPPAATAVAETGFTTLLADRIRIEGKTRLIAEGHVEILFGKLRLKAERVIYDKREERLLIGGPIVLDDGRGTVLLASAAELSPDLREGVLKSARVVLAQQLQLAAVEINRVGGRYIQLYKTVASSCRVCARNPVPLWQIRARRVIHDRLRRQLYFEGAQLRLLDIPVFYLPRLRLPDPTLKRATGFLVPKFNSTSELGFGLKAPYFITLGPHADLLLTPYVSPATRTLEYRLRRKFAHGELTFRGAVSRDDLRPGNTRAYLFGTGGFDLPRGFRLNFSIETVSDPAYLLEYLYSDKDRLQSGVVIHRAKRDSLIKGSFSRFRSLRPGEDNDTLPSLVSDSLYWRRYTPALIGGALDFRIASHGLFRRSDTPGDDGRDMSRLTVAADWERSWILRNGMLVRALAGAGSDLFTVRQDPAYPGQSSSFTPYLGAELRWPMRRITARGATQLFEPVVQLLWSREESPDHPNEDSTFVEFDEGNLFALSRFPGHDRREQGLRANIGMRWQHDDPAGWSLGLTAGRILRQRDLGQFPAESGLSGSASDWLLMAELDLADDLSLANRALFDDSFGFTLNETRVTWRNTRWKLASSYIWVAQDNTSEWTMDGTVKLSDYWTARGSWRYDFDLGRAARAAAGLEYRNECIAIDFSVSRHFTSSSSVGPTTSFDLTVALTGFGTGRTPGPVSRACRR